MNPFKNESKTIIGLVAALASFLTFVMVNYAGFTEAEAAQLVSGVGVIGGILFAWYGRKKASGKINWLGKKNNG